MEDSKISLLPEASDIQGTDLLVIVDVNENGKVTKQVTVNDFLSKTNEINGTNWSAITLQGSWNASTNSPNISTTTKTGSAWRITTAGNTNLGGITDWQIGDLIVKTETSWLKIDNSDIATVWGNIGGEPSDNSKLVNYVSSALPKVALLSAGTEQELIDAITSINTNPHYIAGSISFKNDIALTSARLLNLNTITIDLNGFALLQNGHKIQITGTGWVLKNGILEYNGLTYESNNISNNLGIELLGNAVSINDYSSIIVNGIFETVAFSNYIGTNSSINNPNIICSKSSGGWGRLLFYNCQFSSAVNNSIGGIAHKPLVFEMQEHNGFTITIQAYRSMHHQSGAYSSAFYIKTSTDSKGVNYSSDGSINLANAKEDILIDYTTRPSGGQIGVGILNTIDIIDKHTETNSISNKYLLLADPQTKQLFKVSTDKFASGIVSTNFETHISNTSNPHNVTKTQIGLSNVDNTKDIDKPVSNLQLAAIDSEATQRTDADAYLQEQIDANKLTAGNGLSKVGTKVQLGGPLTQNTEITGGGYGGKTISLGITNDPLSILDVNTNNSISLKSNGNVNIKGEQSIILKTNDSYTALEVADLFTRLLGSDKTYLQLNDNQVRLFANDTNSMLLQNNGLIINTNVNSKTGFISSTETGISHVFNGVNSIIQEESKTKFSVVNEYGTDLSGNFTDLSIPHKKYVVDLFNSLLNQKATVNGIATLDSNGKLTISQIPDSLLGQVTFKGLWSVANNVPTLPEAVNSKGFYYIVTDSGTYNSIGFVSGDWIISDGTNWGKVDNTDAVTSVQGRTGNVVISATDVGLGNVNNTSDIDKPVSTAQQTAINSAQLAITTVLDTKVDKIAGKALSDENYTLVEKQKLASISGTNTGDQTASTVAINATGFSGNLNSEIITVQLLANAVDQLSAGSSGIPNPIVYTRTGNLITKSIEDLGSGLTIEKRYRYYAGTNTPIDGSIDIMETKNSKSNQWVRTTYTYTNNLLSSISNSNINTWTI